MSASPPRFFAIGRRTILRDPAPVPRDPQVIALEALGWILADRPRAERFLELTGLSPETLRASAAAHDTQRAVLDFVLGHEPDLVAAARDLAIPPDSFATARRSLAR